MRSHNRVRITARGVLSAILLAAASPGAAPARNQPQRAADGETTIYGYTVVNAYPHDPGAFTQGLLYRNGFLYESTGLNGRSTVRKVRLESGMVIRKYALDARYFGEGLTDWGDRLIQLTWLSHVGFLYDPDNLEPRGTFSFPAEGWGLTHDRERLIASDGSSSLMLLDPATFAELGRLEVKDGDKPVRRLNELEYVRGEIFANIWHSDRIARIDPRTGRISGWIDLTGLLPEADRINPEAVLNGIAYDAAGDRLFVTGKLWPRLFEIRLVRRR